MKLKALLALVLLIGITAILVLAHKNYKPNLLKIDKPVVLTPLGEIDIILAASKAKDRGMIIGRALEASKERNIFTPDGGEIKATDPGKPVGPVAPAEYPGRLVAISSVDGKPGALIECKNPLQKDAPKNVPGTKPAIGAAPPKPNLQRNQPRPTPGKPAQAAYSSPLKGPGYYKEGETLIDGAVLKKVDFDNRTVIVLYSDSEYTLKLKNDWEALNKVMEEYRAQEQKKVSEDAAAKQREEIERRRAEWRKNNPNAPSPEEIARMREARAREMRMRNEDPSRGRGARGQ